MWRAKSPIFVPVTAEEIGRLLQNVPTVLYWLLHSIRLCGTPDVNTNLESQEEVRNSLDLKREHNAVGNESHPLMQSVRLGFCLYCLSDFQSRVSYLKCGEHQVDSYGPARTPQM